MTLDPKARQRLARLALSDRRAQARAREAREAFLHELRSARAAGETTRYLAGLTGLSHQRIWQLVDGHDKDAKGA